MNGDSPCADCGTKENPIWYTDNTFWNAVMEEEVGKILCTDCFIVRAENKYRVKSWRLIPDWYWRERIGKAD